MKPHIPLVLLVCLPLLLLIKCKGHTEKTDDSKAGEPTAYHSGKPYTRWWWFASKIRKKDVKAQLAWTEQNGFGGVEIAWIYPLYRMNKNIKRDTADHPQPWLSPEWTQIVKYAKNCCDSMGLGCDFTFGTAWPFGDSKVKPSDGVRIFQDTSFRQMISFSWEYPVYGRVINHLSESAFLRYAQRMGHALQPALKGRPSALFCDSWEIKLNDKNKLWTKGFDKLFEKRFHYNILPYMEKGIDHFPHVRYDYMKCLSNMVIDSFYTPFTRICHQLGALSRVQCLASPTDVMQAYASADIPETEAMLNNPGYSRIVSSAACLSGKRIVSSETFTCMYGFPDIYMHEEQTADLKMLADALIAQGVNQIIWHGMPFQQANADTNDFFASVHVGPRGTLAEELPAFNHYLERICAYMQKGKTYSSVAVYIPWEDAVMAGAYPKEKQRVWVWGQYELRSITCPEELHPFHPLWINNSFLQQAEIRNKKLFCGDAQFDMLYLDVRYLDKEALEQVLSFAKQGLPVCLKQFPKQPGKLKSADYSGKVFDLAALPNVKADFEPPVPPLISCDTLIDYWCRMDKGVYYIFFAHPLCHHLEYPITSGQSFTRETRRFKMHIHTPSISKDTTLEFPPYRSILMKIDSYGNITFPDISFTPKDPNVRPPTKAPTYF